MSASPTSKRVWKWGTDPSPADPISECERIDPLCPNAATSACTPTRESNAGTFFTPTSSSNVRPALGELAFEAAAELNPGCSLKVRSPWCTAAMLDAGLDDPRAVGVD